MGKDIRALPKTLGVGPARQAPPQLAEIFSKAPSGRLLDLSDDDDGEQSPGPR